METKMWKSLLVGLFCISLSMSSIAQTGKSARVQRGSKVQSAKTAPIVVKVTESPVSRYLFLRKSTAVKLMMPYPVSISTSKPGEQVLWRVVEDVLIDGTVVIEKGAPATSIVSTIFNVGTQPRRLSVDLGSVQLIDGGAAPLQSTLKGERVLHYFTTPTDDAVVPEGTDVVAYVGADVAVLPPLVKSNASSGSSGSNLVLPDSTPIALKFARAVSSSDAQVGDRLAFSVVEPVQIAHLTVVPRGTIAWGTVTQAVTSSDYGKRGRVAVILDDVQLATGEKAPLRATKEAQGKSKTAETLGLMPFSIIGGAMIAAMQEGNDVTIPVGTEITAYVNGNVTFDASKLSAPRDANTVQSAIFSPDSAIAETTVVEIVSTPAGADIELDGKFAGNTPSTIVVSSAEHEITVSKAGYRPWSRVLTSTGGNVRVFAELTKQQ